MNNTENEGLILSGLLAEHSDIMSSILNTNEAYTHYDRRIKKLERQLLRIEGLILKVIKCSGSEE